MSSKVIVSWEPPSGDVEKTTDDIQKFVVKTDFPGEQYSYQEFPATETSFLVDDVPPGEYTVEIQSVSGNGSASGVYKESILISPKLESPDDFPKVVDDIPLGGTINSPTFFRGVGNNFVFYIQQHDWSFKSVCPESTTVTNLSGIQDTYVQGLANLPIRGTISDNEIGGVLTDAHYILLSVDEPLDKLRLIALEDRFKDPFWFDAGSGEKSNIVGQSNSSYGVALTGTINCSGAELYGTGTDFIGEVLEGDVLFATSSSTGEYLGKVTTIYSDDRLKLDNVAGLSGEDHTFGRVNLRINKQQDSIIARVYKTDANVYEHELYTTLDSTLTPSLLPTSQSSSLIAHFTFDSMINNKVVAVNRKISNFVAEIIPSSNSTANITDQSVIGNALVLDGSQHIRILRDNFAYRHTENSGGDFSFWFRSDSINGNNNAFLIGRKDYWSLRLDQSNAGDQTISLKNDSTNTTLMTALVSQSGWHHVALATDSYTESGKYKAYLYIDRVPIASIEQNSPIFPNDNSEPEGSLVSKPLVMGSSSAAISDNFIGAITDLWVPNRSFSDSEVASFWARQGTEDSSSGQPINIGDGLNSIQVNENGIIVGGVDNSDAPFSVTSTGAIDATSGEVAGWKLSASSIYSGTRPYTNAYSASAGITLRKTGSIHAKNFYIDNDGDAFFRGTISACSGQIGGWQLHEQGIYSSGLSFGAGTDIPAAGFLSNNGIVIHNQGSLHSRNFFINSDGSSSFSGDISGATGTFSGGAGEGTITGSEIQDGSVNANEIASEGIAGYNISPSGTIAVFNRTAGGAIIPSSYAALDGADSNFRIYAGNDNPRLAPFRVTKEGQVTADNLQLFDANNNIYFDSNTGGFTPTALTQMARSFATPVATASDLFTGNVDKTDTSTFQEVVLTASTELVTSISIPTAKMSSKVSSEYFGNRSNPLTITLDISTIGTTGTTNLTRASNIKKPGGVALDRVLKVGELVRFNLENTVSGMTVTSVTGAINALTGTSFSSNYTIPGPSRFSYLLFEISDTSSDFTFNITSTDTANIAMNAEVSATNAAKPTTETSALANIANTVTFGLNRSSGSAEAAATQVIAPVTFSRITTGTPTATQFLAKTLSKDVVDVDTIHSTVAVVPGGSVDSEGFFVTGTDTEELVAGDYYYHSTLSFSGGSSNFHPVNRLFKITSNDAKLIPAPGEGALTQCSQNTAVNNLTLDGTVFSPHATTITPGQNILTGSAGTVTISGNLHVTGTQTTVTQQDLTISDKHITLADGATVASDIDTAGVIVDRTGISQVDAALEWNETNDEWFLTNKTTSPYFRSTVDGTVSLPAYQFGTRQHGTSSAGLWASNYTDADNHTHDQINITTRDKDNAARTSVFNTAGITSSFNVYTADTAQFRNLNGTWHATTGSATGDFKFTNTTSGNDIPIMYLSSQFRRVGIGRTDPQAPLDVKRAETNLVRFESSSSAAEVSIITPGGNQNPARIKFLSAGEGQKEIHLTSRLGNELRVNANTSSVSMFRFIDSATEPSVQIQKSHDFSSAVKPLRQHATLVLHNPHTYDTAAEGRRSHGNALVFTDYLNSEYPVCQRGYIFCGPNQTNAGYGFMEFGLQTEEQFPSPTDDAGLESILSMTREGYVGINGISNDAALQVRSKGLYATGYSRSPSIDIEGWKTTVGENFARLNFRNLAQTTAVRMEGYMPASGGMGLKIKDYAFNTYFDYDLTSDTLIIGKNNTTEFGTVNINNVGFDGYENSFSAGHAAGATKVIFAKPSLKAVKVFAHVDEAGTEFCSELTILCSGVNAYASEYGVICSDGTTRNVKFVVDYVGGLYRLKAEKVAGGAKTMKFQVTYQ